MAKQHIYARTEKGLYSGSAGYDTVQVTAGLSKNFVLKHLHQYCFYQEHRFQDDEKDVMPDVYFLTKADKTGNAIIFGKNIYIREERNSFLSHTIVVSDEWEMNLVYKSPDIVINYDKFFKVSDARMLSEIEISENGIFDMFYTKDTFFQVVGITEQIFKTIVYNIIQAYYDRKQLYIKLDTERKICSEAARQLLRYVFAVLPQPIVKDLSFITYTPEIRPPAFFDIIFVDKNVDLSQVPHGYKLDLTNNISLVEENEYLKMAWLNVQYENKVLIRSISYLKGMKSWNALAESMKVSIDTWRSLREGFKKNMNLGNYFSLLKLAADLSSVENVVRDNSLFILKKFKNSMETSGQIPDMENIEHFFNKTLSDAYVDLVCFNEYAENLYEHMIRKLNIMDNNFKFLALSRIYLIGVSKYLNSERFAELNKRLFDVINAGLDFDDNKATDFLAKKMQEVIIGDISVHLR